MLLLLSAPAGARRAAGAAAAGAAGLRAAVGDAGRGSCGAGGAQHVPGCSAGGAGAVQVAAGQPGGFGAGFQPQAAGGGRWLAAPHAFGCAQPAFAWLQSNRRYRIVPVSRPAADLLATAAPQAAAIAALREEISALERDAMRLAADRDAYCSCFHLVLGQLQVGWGGGHPAGGPAGEAAPGCMHRQPASSAASALQEVMAASAAQQVLLLERAANLGHTTHGMVGAPASSEQDCKSQGPGAATPPVPQSVSDAMPLLMLQVGTLLGVTPPPAALPQPGQHLAVGSRPHSPAGLAPLHAASSPPDSASGSRPHTPLSPHLHHGSSPLSRGNSAHGPPSPIPGERIRCCQRRRAAVQLAAVLLQHVHAQATR
jgi:hypothetical protein